MFGIILMANANGRKRVEHIEFENSHKGTTLGIMTVGIGSKYLTRHLGERHKEQNTVD